MTAQQTPTSPCKGEVGREAAGRGSRFSRARKVTERARTLRKTLTDAEKKLWKALRRGQLDGVSFRRQHPVGPYVLDFYCPRIRLAIEIDGGQHSTPEGLRADRRRTEWLSSKEISILRFWNNDALRNTEGVLAEIVRAANEHARNLTPSPALPLSGGGRSKRRDL